MRRTPWLAALVALLPAIAAAQVPSFPQTLPANTVVGRIGSQSGPSQAIPFATLNSRLGGVISVKGRGAVGDGTADDTAAIQAAATQACGSVGTGGAGSELYFPAGFYKITTAISINCGLKVRGDGWSGDSGQLLQNQLFTTKAGLSGSIILPAATINGLVFTSNQASTIRDIAVVYLPRAAASSGVIGIKIQAGGAPTAPAPLSFQIKTIVDHVWVHGADINLSFTNAGQFDVTNSIFDWHHTNGILIQQPNIPYAGSWRVGPNNVFTSGSVINCQHLLSTSGGGHVIGNTFHSCGSPNVIPPLATDAVMFAPTLNVASNSVEPVIISNNTMEGTSYGIRFYGGTPSQNGAITQFTITGNQIWTLKNIVVSATATNGIWVVGGVISGNYLQAQTLGGITTSTSNIDINGASNINISGNTYSLAQAVGTDTGAAITLGVNTSNICQSSSKIVAGVGVTMAGTVALCEEGGAARRTPFTGPTTFYVRSDGNDTNTCLANTGTAGTGACLTVQGALNKLITNYDLSGYQATISVVNNASTPQTYSAAGQIAVLEGPLVGAPQRAAITAPAAATCPVIIKGSTGTAADIVLTSTGSDTFFGDRGAYFCFQDLTATSTVGAIVRSGGSAGAEIDFSNVVLGASGASKISTSHGGNVEPYGNFSITGNSPCVFQADYGGLTFIPSTVVITQLANITAAFACVNGGQFTYLNTAGYVTGGFTLTGKKFQIDNGGIIHTGTSSLTALPGSLPGTAKLAGYDSLSYFTSGVTVNVNAAAAASPPSGTLAQLSNADSTNTVIALDTYNGNVFSQQRQAFGTGAAPTKVTSGVQFGGYGFSGYATTAGFSAGNSAYTSAKAKEDFNSGTNRGTSLIFGTTPSASGTARTAAELFDGALTLGVAGTNIGSVGLSGNTSGVVSILPQAAAGTYNFNLPTTAGTSGQPLLSGGGGAAAMTFGVLGTAGGGTATDVGTAFTTASPTATCQTGTPTTITTAARYKIVGKIIIWYASITLTNIGTCTGLLNIALPVNAQGTTLMNAFNGSTGVLLQAITSAGNVQIGTVASAFPGVNGNLLFVSGFYESI